MNTNTIYRNDNLQIITEQQFNQSSSAYKDTIVDNNIKIRERYLGGDIFEIQYYKNPNENEMHIVERYKSLPYLKSLNIRERETYGNLWIDKVKYFDLDENSFSPFIIRELNDGDNVIAWECINPTLPLNNEHYYNLTKTYYNTDNGIYGEYFKVHFRAGIFSDIEHFSIGIDTDYQDVERGIYGVYAEDLMTRMNIPPKMQAWYLNNKFLPEL